MKKNNSGITLITLIVTIIILVILAGVAMNYIAGDNGVISNAMKMEIETAKGELRDRFLLLLNTELVSASAEIAGTTTDIGTKYNEGNLINFLNGNQNFTGGNAEQGAIDCLDDTYTPGEGEDEVKTIKPKYGDGEIKSKYRIIAKNLCPDGDKYGIGKNIKEGNIFTLEAILEKDNAGASVSSGKFELVYYDLEGKRDVLETVSLYLTNQS